MQCRSRVHHHPAPCIRRKGLHTQRNLPHNARHIIPDFPHFVQWGRPPSPNSGNVFIALALIDAVIWNQYPSHCVFFCCLTERQQGIIWPPSVALPATSVSIGTPQSPLNYPIDFKPTLKKPVLCYPSAKRWFFVFFIKLTYFGHVLSAKMRYSNAAVHLF